MESKLSVEIGANLSNLNAVFAKAASTVESGTKSMNDQIGKTERSFKLLNNTKFTFGGNYLSESRKLALEAARSGAALGGSLKKGANEAGQALTNLGRIAQDAPFGFIGIQNNLNPLLESFGRLKAETGSTGSALKALGSSLIGPAGLGIALSVVSAAVLFYQQYQQRANKATENAKKVTDDYAESLDQVSQAQLKGAQSAQSELITLKLLYERTQNLSLSNKQRVQAVNELQDKYPAYFGNLKDEAILAGQAGTKYNELASAILATAKARAATDLIVKNQTRKLEDEQKIIDLQKEELKLYNSLYIIKQREEQLEKDRARNGSGGNAGIGSSQGMGFAREKAALEGKIAENRRLQTNFATDISIIDGKNLQLTKSINAETAKGLVDTGKGGVGKSAEDINKLRNELQELKDGNYIKGLELLQKSFEQLGDTVKGLNKGKLNSEPLISMDSILPKNMARLVAQELELINFELIKFNDDASSIINGNLVETFSGIGDAIGDALSGGQNLLTGLSMTLLSSLGSVVTDLGRLAIATGVGIKAIRTAFKTLNPLVAIAAGVGLIALGSAITKSVGKLGEKIPGYANGTNSARGGIALVGERGPELVNLPTGSAVTPNHQIAGMMGGGNVFIPDMVLRGEDIWVSFRKVDKRFKGLG